LSLIMEMHSRAINKRSRFRAIPVARPPRDAGVVEAAIMSSDSFEIPRLEELRATRGGRVALAGFEYQRAFAVLRLAAMAIQQPVQGCTAIPSRLRYEWAEDVDEVSTTGEVLFWQCKHGDGWSQPARLAEVLLGFAPKWLWSSVASRKNIAFRLVTSAREYAAFHDAPGLPPDREKVRKAFLGKLSLPASPNSDRALWTPDAAAAGHEELFDALWNATRVLYIPGTTETHDGMAVWAAERQAVNALAMARKVADVGRLGEIVTAIRALLSVHQPGPADAAGMVDRPEVSPCSLLAIDVDHRLFSRSGRLRGAICFGWLTVRNCCYV
jgi:hypothetical protein